MDNEGKIIIPRSAIRSEAAQYMQSLIDNDIEQYGFGKELYRTANRVAGMAPFAHDLKLIDEDENMYLCSEVNRILSQYDTEQ